MKITDSPNMVCTVNHATEDLQHRILDYSKYCFLHCHVKIERVREREDSDGGGNSVEQEESIHRRVSTCTPFTHVCTIVSQLLHM